jgi:hypothetical protein
MILYEVKNRANTYIRINTNIRSHIGLFGADLGAGARYGAVVAIRRYSGVCGVEIANFIYF